MAKTNSIAYKAIYALVACAGIFLGSFSLVGAFSTFAPSQGGTGTTTPTGILYGTGAANQAQLQTVVPGANCTFAAGVFNCTGGGGSGSGTVATSTPLVSGQVDFSTGVSTIGNDSTFLFDTATKKLTATFASTTAISAASICFTGDICRQTWPTGSSGTGSVSTSSLETAGFLAYWNTTAGYPAKLDKVGTTSLTASGVVSLSNPVSVIGPSASAITITGGTNGQILGWSAGAPTWVATSSIANTAATAFSTTTASVYIDSGRIDTYTADGSIFRPFTTIAAANAYVTASSYSAAVYYFAPGSSYTPQSFSFPNLPLTIHGNGATVIVLSGASLGAGTITVPNSMSWYDPVVFGKIVFSSTSLTTPHGLHNAFVDGSLYFAGLGTIDGTSVILDQNQAAFGFLSQTASSTIEVGPGALTAFSTINIQTVINDYGVLNIDIANMQVATSSRYAIMATSTGSAVRINGFSLQNEGTGGAINCANGASTASANGPNQISNIQVTEGAGSTNGIDCGSATTFVGHYTIFTRAGARLSATGSDKQVPSMEGILIDTFIAIATSTSRFPLTIASTTGPQLALTDGSNNANIWTERAINGSFFLATSSPTTYATSSVSALSINANGQLTLPFYGASTGCAQFGAAGLLTNTGSTCLTTGAVVTIAQGGTGVSSLTANQILYTTNAGTGVVTAASSTLLGVGTLGQVWGYTSSGGSWIATSSSGGGSGTVGSGTTGQIPYYAGAGTTLTATSSIFVSVNSAIGIGTLTPGSSLEVLATSTAATGNAFIAWDSAARNIFNIENDGNIGIGTSSPYATLSIFAAGSKKAWFAIGSSTGEVFSIRDSATSYFGLGTSTSALTTATTTILQQKLQWQGGNSAGVTDCVYINASNALVVQAGACL